MNRLTNKEAAALLLQLFPRMQFAGNELGAVNSLHVWAVETANDIKPEEAETE